MARLLNILNYGRRLEIMGSRFKNCRPLTRVPVQRAEAKRPRRRSLALIGWREEHQNSAIKGGARR